MEDLSHGFLANRWFINNRFVDLGNLFEVVMHYLLIEEMIGLGY